MRDLKSRKTGRGKANRRKQKRRAVDWKGALHRLLRLGVFAGSAVLLVSGGAVAIRLLFESDYFRIGTVEVVDAARVSRQDVLALSDIEPGMSIFEIDLDLIGRKIEENPWIAAAEVSRSLPQEVRIRVVERVPRAVVSLGYLYYADDSGEIFKLLGPEDRLDYPVVTGLKREFLLAEPEKGRALLKEAMGLIAEIERRERFTLAEVSELHLDPVEGISIFTTVGGVPIRMGHGNFASKLDRLERIFAELEPQLPVLNHIDLNVMERVIVRYADDAFHGRG